jgi:hypothetical protein
MDYDRFYNSHVRILIAHGESIVGTSSFDPELMQSKMILPVFASNSHIKLGDFELRVSVVKPPTDQGVMREISGFLSKLQH